MTNLEPDILFVQGSRGIVDNVLEALCEVRKANKVSRED